MAAIMAKRGRPKLDWTPIEDELEKRLSTGEALETVTKEARYLAWWAKERGHATSTGTYLKWERIRDRMRRRFNGAGGYKAAQSYRLQNYIASLKQRAASH